MPRFWIFALLLFCSGCSDQNRPQGSIEVKKVLENYVDAFNRHDPQAMASYWSESGEIVHPISGRTIRGRAELEEQLARWFTVRKAERMEASFVDYSSPKEKEMVVKGLFKITLKDHESPIESAFEATLADEQGKWRIAKIRIINMDVPNPNASHLEPLSFLIGNWEDNDPDSTVKTRAHWDRNRNFIIQEYSISVYGQDVLEGRQIIGWDPVKKEIRSWMFDSDGGFGEAKWYSRDGSFYAASSYILGDGTKASMVNVYKPLDKDKYLWSSEGRDIGGAVQPNIDPVEVVRKGGGRW